MTEQNSVFISYSSKDREFVRRITEELERMGVGYWKAPEMIPAGSSYAREIPLAIQNCDVFLLVLSPTSQDSIWVEKEIDSAICNRKKIIPFQIQKMTLNETFRFYLNNVQMISYYNNPVRAFSDLRKQLEQLLPNTALPAGGESEASDKGEKINGSPEKDKAGVNPEKNKMNGNLNKNKDKRPAGGGQGLLQNTRRTIQNRGRESNAFRMNRIPMACEYCGCKDLLNVTRGTFQCERCGKDNYDDFQTIRNYLEKAGAASALVIERDTGVPRRIIEYFFRDEYLEIPKNSPIRVSCQQCGAPIRTSTLCDKCKAASSDRMKNDRTGTWHSWL